MVEPIFEVPDDKAQRWIGGMVESMRTFLRNSDRLQRDEVAPADLDEVWVDLRTSLKGSNADARSVENAINGVGLTFGQILVDRFGMEWVIATDSEGTDIAVRGNSGWLVYPTNVVRKRYENEESGFLTALFQAVAERSS
jgi:hypothetical protein